MLIGGIWHGASWNFVIWGGLHSAYLIIQKSITKKFPSVANNKFLKTKFGKIISIIIVQYFIFLAWIPFRVRDFDSMLYSIEKYLIWDFSIIDIIDIHPNFNVFKRQSEKRINFYKRNNYDIQLYKTDGTIQKIEKRKIKKKSNIYEINECLINDD